MDINNDLHLYPAHGMDFHVEVVQKEIENFNQPS